MNFSQTFRKQSLAARLQLIQFWTWFKIWPPKLTNLKKKQKNGYNLVNLREMERQFDVTVAERHSQHILSVTASEAERDSAEL